MNSFVNLSQSIEPGLNWQAVCVVLVDKDGIYLLKRSETMPTHAGQLGCIGGNKKDQESPLQTAMREFVEETNLSPEFLQVLGYLPTVYTARNQLLLPVLASLKDESCNPLITAQSNGEWSEMLFIEWERMKDSSRWQWAQRKNVNGEFFPVYFRPILPLEYRSSLGESNKSYMLWGATASIVLNLLSENLKI